MCVKLIVRYAALACWGALLWQQIKHLSGSIAEPILRLKGKYNISRTVYPLSRQIGEDVA